MKANDGHATIVLRGLKRGTVQKLFAQSPRRLSALEFCLDLFYAVNPEPTRIVVAVAPDVWEDFRTYAPIGRGASCTRDNVRIYRCCVVSPGGAIIDSQ